jgi:solute carrier family 25 S-adenosylmethionine transporter 26
VDLSLYPIDTLKTRLQSSKGFLAFGGFSGVYRGVGSAVVGSAPGAALFFVTYDGAKRALSPGKRYARNAEGKEYVTRGEERWREPLTHMAAASAGEVAACAVRVPTEVVKQRAQALQYPSSAAALRGILGQRKTVGLLGVWRELYRGWSITIMREVPFTVIQFPLWEGLKSWSLARSSTNRSQVSAPESAVFGSIAGAIAAGITTPLDVLKTRLMLAREKVPATQMLASILRESGPRAFFAGIGPRVMWISIGGAVFLGSYQWAINRLGGNKDER